MQILVPTDREGEVLTSMIAGAVIDLILNLLLIPKFGASGASIGTLAAELTVVLVQMRVLKGFLAEVKKDFKIFYYIIGLLPASFAAWAAGNALAPVVNEMFSLEKSCFAVLAATAALFFGIYGIVLLLFKEPITMEYIFPYLKKIGQMMPRKKVEG